MSRDKVARALQRWQSWYPVPSKGLRVFHPSVSTLPLALPASSDAGQRSVFMSAQTLAILARVGRAPLVGRDDELALLSSRLNAAAAPPGAVIVVSGEPGAGKTRLATEAASLAARQRAQILSLRCYQETSTLPYAPFTDLGDLLPELARLLAEGSDANGARSADGARLGLFERVDQFLQDAAGASTHILVVDDLQWADAATLDLLRHLARRGRRGRRAFLITLRSSEVRAASAAGQMLADFAREDHYLELPVGALTPEACHALLTALCGAVDSTFVAAIYARTQGVPFFVEELVRQLATDERALHAPSLGTDPRAVAGSAEAEANLTDAAVFALPIPTSVASAMLRRVAQLPDTCRRALHLCALLGATCPARLLANILELPLSAVQEDLQPAIAAGLLRLVVSPPHEDQYAFAHVLQRDALYAELAPQERRDLHVAAARALAVRTASGEANQAIPTVPWALVAYHAERARDWPLAYSAAVAAGDAALTVLAGSVALTHFRCARDLASGTRVTSSPAERIALHQRMVRALLSVGHMEDAAAEAQRLVAAAERDGDDALAAWALIHLGQACTLAHRLDEAQVALERGLALGEALADDDLRAAALANLGVLLDKGGDLDAAEARIQAALALSGSPRNNALTLLGFIYTGYCAYWRGDFAFAVQRLREALSLAEAAHDALSVASARFCLALALGSIGYYEEALAYLHTLLDFSAMTGEPYYAARVPNSIGWIYRELGLYEQAVAWDERAVTETATGDWPDLFEARANSLLNLASDLIALGRLAEVPAILDRAAEATEHDEFMRWRNANRLLLCQGELTLARCESDEAFRRAEEALARAEEKRAEKYIAQAYSLAGRVLALAGDHAAALDWLERGATIAAEIGHSAGRWHILAAMSATLGQLDRDDEAAECLAEARRVVEGIAARLRDEALRAEFLSSPSIEALYRSAAAGTAVEKSGQPPYGLTLREVEVLQCVARGLTNREIAAALVISERTVNSHLVHIFNKLEVNSRSAAASRALRLGLVT